MYSQNGEDKIALGYFGDKVGTLLDLGANDGKTLSNSLALIESGWSAVLVEPSKEAFRRCEELHNGNDKVKLLNVAIDNNNGFSVFHESGSHLNIGDTALLSSLKKTETLRWFGTNNEFTEGVTECLDFKTLLELSPIKTFDLISIDCEGMDWDILTQIDLRAVECKMLIVEHNQKDIQLYVEYARGFGMKELSRNFENIIFIIGT
jgi:FkbM family methyltransferase